MAKGNMPINTDQISGCLEHTLHKLGQKNRVVKICLDTKTKTVPSKPRRLVTLS